MYCWLVLFAALALAVADAAEEGHLVLLELHPGTTAVAEPPARERVDDVGGGHLDVGREPLEDGDERGSVGLPGGEPTKHGRQSFMSPFPTLRSRQ